MRIGTSIKIISLLLCAAVAAAFTGCGGARDEHSAQVPAVSAVSEVSPAVSAADGSSEAVDGSSEAADGSSEAVDGMSEAVDGSSEADDGSSEAADGSSEAVDGSSEAAEASETSDEAAPGEKFVFRPKVCPPFMRALYGETKCEAWFSLVDAILAGKDSFPCPDKHTYLWVTNEFPNACFPVLREIVTVPANVLDVTVDGTAPIIYKVPKEEAAVMIEDFKALVEGILNEALKPEYTDFEKALALYLYFSDNYDYDTAALVKSNSTGVGYVCSYRLLTKKTGICSEIAPAYSYLLTQAGMNASVVICGNHEWSIIELGGKYYHVDPTFVLSDRRALAYFLMNDERRSAGVYPVGEFLYVSDIYRPGDEPVFKADDDTFADFRSRYAVSFDHESSTLEYTSFDEPHTFDYSGY